MNPLIQAKTTTRIASNSVNRGPRQRALVPVPMAPTCIFRVPRRRIWDSTLGHMKSFRRRGLYSRIPWGLSLLVACTGTCLAQLTDQTQAPNTAKAGIAKSLQDEVGAGRGDPLTPNSSIFIINRDPFRSVRRGRQLFQ